jgi:hypothetical protein
LDFSFHYFHPQVIFMQGVVTGVRYQHWGDADSAWEQEKLAASLSWPKDRGKMLENRKESPASSVYIVRRF